MVLRNLAVMVAAQAGRALNLDRQAVARLEIELLEEADVLEARVKAAEEQAAAAWDRVGKLEKVVEELRDAVASEIYRIEGHL